MAHYAKIIGRLSGNLTQVRAEGGQRICSHTRRSGGAEASFQFASVDVTGPYLTTQGKNKYLLSFIDHFTKYVEAFPIPDQTTETCARVYATQIVTRHGTGSKLTDQGRSFMQRLLSVKHLW